MIKFFIAVILTLIFISSTNLTFAQSINPSNQFSPVNYTLPYPGILPDNPLYKLKVLRDIIVGFFITDPISKADYELELSDKRTESSQMLYDEGEKKLALTTISKGQNYFAEALIQLKLAKKQHEIIGDTLQKMNYSNKLREYMLSNMITYSGSDTKDNFKGELNRAINFQKEINPMLKRF